MAKTPHLCKWKKSDVDDRFDALCDIVREPKYICRRCRRVADRKKWLCKPTAL